MFRYTLLVLLYLLLLASCKQKAGEPAYLKIESFEIKTNNLAQGTALQQITEAFVYIDDQIAGVYHLPASIPFVLSGSHSVKIGPAVIENAIASNIRYAYTYLNAFDTSVIFKPGSTATIHPKSSYRNTVKFELIEDFENPLPLIAKTAYNTMDTLLRDSLFINNIEPGHCALFNIKNGEVMEYATRNEYSLPLEADNPNFLEIHYKSALPLAIGAYIDEPTIITKTGIVTLNPKDTWSKAYINLSTVVSAKPKGTKFRIFISSYNSDGSTKQVLVDNIKIIHFE